MRETRGVYIMVRKLMLNFTDIVILHRFARLLRDLICTDIIKTVVTIVTIRDALASLM